MAGHRRTRAPRNSDGSVHPMLSKLRPARIRATLEERYAEARTEAARVAVAKDFVLSAGAALHKRDPATANLYLASVSQDLRRVGEQLLSALEQAS